MRTRLASRLNPLLSSLPSKFAEIHDWQVDAILDISSAFLDDEAKVVVLEAPTGSGKTLIAECVRRILDTRATYICHNKDLQAQFAGDFPYSKVLYGRDNYTPTNPTIDGATCGDCTWTAQHKRCVLCRDRASCPYQVAKQAAIFSPVPVLNSSYWLNEVQAGKSRFAKTGLAIFDEADTLEKVLMDQVEIYISPRSQERYRIDPPRKLTVDSAFLPWCKETLETLTPHLSRLDNIDFASVQQARELKRLVTLYSNVTAMQSDLEMGQPWVYTGGAGSNRRQGDAISFRPVKVDRFGAERIWANDHRFLLMSGSIVSPSQTVESLGWSGAYSYVTVDSQFHPSNRQVVVKGLADVTRRGLDDAGRRRIRDGVNSALLRHEGERGIVHGVSYSLSGYLYDSCKDLRPGRVLTYRNSGERAESIRRYRETDSAVLIGPSIDRGVDFPGELCRFQVIVKVPFLSLGDKQVAERLYKTPDGKVWYNVHVARTIMQMVGRGVRSTDDYCTCYIFDTTFQKWYRSWGHLLPKWFRKGIRFE